MTGTFKKNKQITRAAAAYEINAKLIGTGVNVIGGGSDGPYTLLVKRLNRKELDLLLRIVKAVKNVS